MKKTLIALVTLLSLVSVGPPAYADEINCGVHYGGRIYVAYIDTSVGRLLVRSYFNDLIPAGLTFEGPATFQRGPAATSYTITAATDYAKLSSSRLYKPKKLDLQVPGVAFKNADCFPVRSPYGYEP